MSIVVLLALSAPTPEPQPRAEVIERTVAIVDGQAITLLDLRTVRALGLVSGDETAVRTRLIDRVLMLREADRYAPPEPAADAVRQQVAALRAAQPAWQETLSAGGFSDARVQRWVRDDLRLAAALDQRFAVAGDERPALVAEWLADLRRRAVIVLLP